MYGVVKNGVYLQDIIVVTELVEAKLLLVDKVNEDGDNYHSWELYEVLLDRSISEWRGIYRLSKPVVKTVKIGYKEEVIYDSVTYEDLDRHLMEYYE